MIRVLAVDDEPLALRQIVAYINRIEDLQLVAECRSALDAHKILTSEPVDVIFCDINMPDLNGMDFARQLTADTVVERQPLIVFTTAYSEYAVEGFKVDAVDYLLKPFSFDDFKRSLERVRQRLQNPILFIRADHRTIGVQISDIIRVQAMGEYLRIFLTGQSRSVMTLMSMKRMEEEIPQGIFMRVHRSHFINLLHVAEIVKGRIILDDGSEVPVGDNYKAAFDEWAASRTLGKGK